MIPYKGTLTLTQLRNQAYMARRTWMRKKRKRGWRDCGCGGRNRMKRRKGEEGEEWDGRGGDDGELMEEEVMMGMKRCNAVLQLGARERRQSWSFSQFGKSGILHWEPLMPELWNKVEACFEMIQPCALVMIFSRPTIEGDASVRLSSRVLRHTRVFAY